MASYARRESVDGRVTYRALIRLAGFPPRSATFNRMSHARSWAAKTEEEMRAGRYRINLTAQEKTVAMLIDQYVDTVLEVKSRKRSYIAQQKAQLAWWRSRLGQYTLAQLSQGQIAEERDKLLAGTRASGRLTGATVNRYLAVLSHALSTAVTDWKWIEKHPMEGMKKKKESRGRSRYLLPHEYPALLMACKLEQRKPLYLIVLLAIFTGARKMEILTLKRKEVNLAENMAVIHDTKNGEPRTLYLFDEMVELLGLWMGGLRHRGNLVFQTRSGLPLNIEREWRDALRVAGIEDFRFHDLRHTHASYLKMYGENVSANDIATSLGQRGLANVTRYTHLSDNHMRGIVTGMAARVFRGEAGAG